MPIVPSAGKLGLGQQLPSADKTPFQAFQTDIGMFGGGQAQSLLSAGKGVQVLGQVASNLSIISDQNAANRAMNEARVLLDDQMLEGLYSRTTQDIFAEGAGPKDVYTGTTKTFDQVQRRVSGTLANDRQRMIFNNAWLKHQSSEGRRASTHIASQFRKYTGEVSAQQKVSAEQNLGQVASQIEQDWSNANSTYLGMGQEVIAQHIGTGLNPVAAQELAAQWPDYVASSAVRGWFAAHPNSTQAAQELASGKFADQAAQDHWDQLDPKQRKAVSSDLVGRARQVSQMKNFERNANTTRQETTAAVRVNEFFTMDTEAQRPQRITIYEESKNSPFIKPNVKKAMRDNLYSGAVVQDSEPGLLALEQQIRDGDIRTASDAMAFRFGEDRVATDGTMRTRVLPLLKATQDQTFTDSYNAGLASMGIVDAMSETSSVLKKRAATFRTAILDWKVNQAGTDKDPYNNDPWKAATSIATQIKADIKVDPAVMTMLRSMKVKYESALSEGNVAMAASARKSMDSLMSVLGVTLEDIK